MIRHHHGGDLTHIKTLYPAAPRPWIDLSTGISPYPYPWLEKLDPAWIRQAAGRLPSEKDIEHCKNAYAAYLSPRLSPDQLVLAPGSQYLIETLPGLFPKNEVFIATPTYSEHARCWRRAGHRVVNIPYGVNAIHDTTLLENLPPGKVLILTHPNNPDGRCIDPPTLYNLVRDYSQRGGTVIIDEAFADTTPAVSLLHYNILDNVVVLRSAGKFSGLAGLRLGAAVCTQYLARKLKTHQGMWTISTLSLLVFTRLFEDAIWIDENRRRLKWNMTRLRKLLEKYGFAVRGGTSLFCLTEGRDMCAKADILAQAGIYVRRFTERDHWLRFGLPPNDSAWHRLENTLERIFHDFRS
ncbi:threonine-phosphate decarboxylase [Luteithermobacter gelatinilyticus]|uniref:threonine-phosphate decarboxylase n=1 Tax=Luteithermobacter gelatinilyticus TaxID=2582913 RepID=UPI001105F603|nr:threonine-phosphate decarboxylase [Luteithermobacter gelatinilyticus]